MTSARSSAAWARARRLEAHECRRPRGTRNSNSRCRGGIQSVVCGEVRRRRLCAALFPEKDPENQQSGSASGCAALSGFVEGARSMSKKRFANVWDAIEDTPAQAENMKLRSALIMALKDHIARTGLSQSEAAKLLGVTQPRISDLMRGKIELFGLDTLVNLIGAAGLHVEMRVSDAADQKLKSPLFSGPAYAKRSALTNSKLLAISAVVGD